MNYSFSISNNIQAGVLSLDNLQKEISDAGLPIESIAQNGDNFDIIFSQSLTSQEEIELNALVSNHQGDPLFVVRNVIQDARNFFDDLLNNFAAENVLLGITQAGKTRDVADYLRDVMYYGQSGSLYEVLGVINQLQQAGYPTDLEPFITEVRMTLFKSKIEGYLGL